MKFKHIFKFLNKKQPSEPVIGPYVRTEQLRNELLAWEIQNGWEHFSSILNYSESKRTNFLGDTYYQYRDKAANGILIPSTITKQKTIPMKLVMEGLVDRILDFDYYRNHAYEQREVLVSSEKLTIFQYLKPNFDIQNLDSIPQRYGNIIIEYVELNNQYHSLKLMSQIYQGRPYEPAKGFDEFMMELGL